MAKRQADTELERELSVNSPASKKPRFAEADFRNGHLNGREWEQDERNHQDILAAADLEASELQEAVQRQAQPVEGYGDLYLDTINRAVLDFDFEKLCSISLSNINVYACLVCGKYFQGRGNKSHAYFHALEIGHHVFVNMETKKVYVLPEGYEVKSKSLDDIKYVVDPTFTKNDVLKLDKEVRDAWDLLGKKYRPGKNLPLSQISLSKSDFKIGYVGMNNIKANDYLNVVVQVLAHVTPIRNFFLLQNFPVPGSPQLSVRFSTLVRKLWNPKAFKSHVSPHELLQEIALRSSKRFTLTHQSDPVEFLSWFLNNLHLSLGGSKKPSKTPTSVIQQAFQGHLRIESQAITAHSDTTNSRLVFAANRESIIPQIPLTTLLNKYNGITASEKLSHRVRHRLLHPLPPYLLFHIKRFSKNKFVSERNPTIVTFPSPRSLDMSPYVEPNPEIWPPGEPIIYDLVSTSY